MHNIASILQQVKMALSAELATKKSSALRRGKAVEGGDSFTSANNKHTLLLPAGEGGLGRMRGLAIAEIMHFHFR